MSKMAEEAYLKDKYSDEEYVKYLEDKIEMLIEIESKLKGKENKFEEINKLLERNTDIKLISMDVVRKKK